MGVNMESCEAIEEQIKTLRDVPKKWNVPTTFRLDNKITHVFFFRYIYICLLFLVWNL